MLVEYLVALFIDENRILSETRILRRLVRPLQVWPASKDGFVIDGSG